MSKSKAKNSTANRPSSMFNAVGSADVRLFMITDNAMNRARIWSLQNNRLQISAELFIPTHTNSLC